MMDTGAALELSTKSIGQGGQNRIVRAHTKNVTSNKSTPRPPHAGSEDEHLSLRRKGACTKRGVEGESLAHNMRQEDQEDLESMISEYSNSLEEMGYSTLAISEGLIFTAVYNALSIEKRKGRMKKISKIKSLLLEMQSILSEI